MKFSAMLQLVVNLCFASCLNAHYSCEQGVFRRKARRWYVCSGSPFIGKSMTGICKSSIILTRSGCDSGIYLIPPSQTAVIPPLNLNDINLPLILSVISKIASFLSSSLPSLKSLQAEQSPPQPAPTTTVSKLKGYYLLFL